MVQVVLPARIAVRARINATIQPGPVHPSPKQITKIALLVTAAPGHNHAA